jgi:hypothetical protein
MPLNPGKCDETGFAEPLPKRQATMDFRFRRVSSVYFPFAGNIARGLPVSACSFTQSCRGCLQSKPAGEVID